jgi:hypothetical protein
MISLPAPTMPAPENVFVLKHLSMPTEKDADPYGDVLFFSRKSGWIITKLEETQDMIEEYNCTHWTWTPETPPADDYELDSTRTEYLRNTGWLKD